MAIKRYEFCAPAHHRLLVGGEEYAGGELLSLDEDVAATIPTLAPRDEVVVVSDFGDEPDPSDPPKVGGSILRSEPDSDDPDPDQDDVGESSELAEDVPAKETK